MTPHSNPQRRDATATDQAVEAAVRFAGVSRADALRTLGKKSTVLHGRYCELSAPNCPLCITPIDPEHPDLCYECGSEIEYEIATPTTVASQRGGLGVYYLFVAPATLTTLSIAIMFLITLASGVAAVSCGLCVLGIPSLALLAMGADPGRFIRRSATVQTLLCVGTWLCFAACSFVGLMMLAVAIAFGAK